MECNNKPIREGTDESEKFVEGILSYGNDKIKYEKGVMRVKNL